MAIRVGRRLLFSVVCMAHELRGLAIRLGVGPLSVVVEVREDIDGANDGVGRNFDGGGSLDERGEREADCVGALIEKAGRVGVAIDRGVVGDAVVLCDAVGAVPCEEILIDGGAVGVVADAAFAAVARGGRAATLRAC